MLEIAISMTARMLTAILGLLVFCFCFCKGARLFFDTLYPSALVNFLGQETVYRAAFELSRAEAEDKFCQNSPFDLREERYKTQKKSKKAKFT